MKKTFRSVKGASDFYPPQAFYFESIIEQARSIFKNFAYEPIILPHLEEEGLFKRSVGAITDIVQKQIFKIDSKDIVLRPEGTAQVARFYIEKSLYKHRDFHKFYYIGSMFRGERPQKGRLREFHHIGAEAIGSNSFYLDAEIIDIATRIIKASGIEDSDLKINSLGCLKDRNSLSESIKKKLSQYKYALCADCKKRLISNPLRVLDCKIMSCQKVVSSLRIGSKHLCESCDSHFFNLLSLLDELNISYIHDPLLVRGLDYYTNTVFEITSSRLGSQDALGAGGRYNELIHNLGGPKVPAIGFALGLERMLLLFSLPKDSPGTKVSVLYTSADTYKEAYKIARLLRSNGISTSFGYKDKSLKAQLKNAQKLNIPFAVIVGDEELKKSCVVVRSMRKSTQEKIKLNVLLETVKKMLG